MKLLISSFLMIFTSFAFASSISMGCGEEGEQDVYAVDFNIEAQTVTVSKNGDVLCENTEYLVEGEIFDYGSGDAVFYCGDQGFEYDNRYDETVLYVDGVRDSNGWSEEFFCYDL